ncbi:MAG: leucine-rich repeat domain-containing protein [Prevotella sp.]|nr:leucine-rich repeat domain-containing protein [Prevotella sp.]
MKKSTLLKTMLAVLLLSLQSLRSLAFYVDGIYYKITSSENLTVEVTYNSNYNSYSGDVIIPSSVEYDGITYYVTSIGNLAFEDSRGLNSVEIPSSVTSIGVQAFNKCSGLTAIKIPCNVTSIKNYAFDGCTKLSEIIFEDGIENISLDTKTLFTDCPIETLYLGRDLSYSTVPFSNKELLTTLTIGESVTTLGNSLFYGCTGLNSVTIPTSVTNIGTSTFENCTGLTEVNYNAIACTSAGSSSSPVFSGCTNLSKINIGDKVTTIPAYLFYNCTALTSLTIPSDVTIIGGLAFGNCSALTELTYNATECGLEISSSEYVFKNCDNLTIATIGDNVKTIPANLFYNCTGLSGVTIGTSVTFIGSSAFYGCTGLKELTYNAIECTSAGSSSSYILEGCTNLTNVTIGGYVTTIPDYTFCGCKNLTGISSLNPTPPTIYSNTFDNITELEVPIEALNIYALTDYWSEIQRIYANSGGDVYYPVPIKSDDEAVVNVSEGDETGTVAKENDVVTINSVDDDRLNGLVFLYETEITEDLMANGEYSFTVTQYHKQNTTHTYYIGEENEYDITVEEAGQVLSQVGINTIDNVYKLKITGDINGTDVTAIRRMTNLKVLDLSDANIVSGGNKYYDDYSTSNNVVGDYFFYDMNILKEVTLPNSAIKIKEYAFGNCTGIASMTISKAVTSIASYAFANCTGIKVLTLEDGTVDLSLSGSTASTSPFCDTPISILYLGRNISYNYIPFKEKQSLTSLTIGKNVTEIGESYFYNCSCLESVDMGNGVLKIGNSAFEGCKKLSSLTISSNASSIGSKAFYNCSSLSEIYSKNATPPTIESNTFSGVDKNTCILYVPEGSINDYWLDLLWGEFFNIMEVEIVEPTILTYAASDVSINSATLSGNVTAGNEDLESQGFEYWTDSNDIQTVLADDTEMTVSLTDLVEGTMYYYRAFATTQNGTYYGETLSFTTLLGGINNIIGEATEVSGYYTIDGQVLNAPVKGVNIVKYADGKTKKILVR